MTHILVYICSIKPHMASQTHTHIKKNVICYYTFNLIYNRGDVGHAIGGGSINPRAACQRLLGSWHSTNTKWRNSSCCKPWARPRAHPMARALVWLMPRGTHAGSMPAPAGWSTANTRSWAVRGHALLQEKKPFFFHDLQFFFFYS